MMISIKPEKIANFLLSLCLFLGGFSFLIQIIKYSLGYDYIFGIVPLFDVDQEANIPTWFTSILLLLAAIILGVVTLRKYYSRDRYKLHWLILSFIFLYLSLDEVAGVHEKANFILNAKITFVNSDPFNLFLLIILAIFYGKFMLHLPKQTLIQFIGAASLFITGALLIEFINVNFFPSIYWQHSLLNSLIVTIEELLEMFGAVLFIYSLIFYLGQKRHKLRLEFVTTETITEYWKNKYLKSNSNQ